METQKIYVQHEENKIWMSKLLFFKDEIKVMKHRLEEIVSKNTSKDMLAQAEHFQNQIIIAQNTADELKHEVNISNDIINDEIKNNGTAVDRRSINDHSKLREEMELFEKSFTSIKAELNVFVAKWI